MWVAIANSVILKFKVKATVMPQVMTGTTQSGADQGQSLQGILNGMQSVDLGAVITLNPQARVSIQPPQNAQPFSALQKALQSLLPQKGTTTTGGGLGTTTTIMGPTTTMGQ
jgi:hypothetical protein